MVPHRRAHRREACWTSGASSCTISLQVLGCYCGLRQGRGPRHMSAENTQLASTQEQRAHPLLEGVGALSWRRRAGNRWALAWHTRGLPCWQGGRLACRRGRHRGWLSRQSRGGLTRHRRRLAAAHGCRLEGIVGRLRYPDAPKSGYAALGALHHPGVSEDHVQGTYSQTGEAEPVHQGVKPKSRGRPSRESQRGRKQKHTGKHN